MVSSFHRVMESLVDGANAAARQLFNHTGAIGGAGVGHADPALGTDGWCCQGSRVVGLFLQPLTGGGPAPDFDVTPWGYSIIDGAWRAMAAETAITADDARIIEIAGAFDRIYFQVTAKAVADAGDLNTLGVWGGKAAY